MSHSLILSKMLSIMSVKEIKISHKIPAPFSSPRSDYRNRRSITRNHNDFGVVGIKYTVRKDGGTFYKGGKPMSHLTASAGEIAGFKGGVDLFG